MALPRTPDALAQVEHALISSYGDMTLAARNLQISPYDLHQWQQSDPEVAQRLHAARLLGWQALEAEAIRRATGYEEEVWYQGVMVGTTTKYSDGLLQTMLKARVPGHREDTAQRNAPMVQINVMPRASTYEEWQQQRQKQLSHQDDPQVVEAEYTEVSTGNGLPDLL